MSAALGDWRDANSRKTALLPVACSCADLFQGQCVLLFAISRLREINSSLADLQASLALRPAVHWISRGPAIAC